MVTRSKTQTHPKAFHSNFTDSAIIQRNNNKGEPDSAGYLVYATVLIVDIYQLTPWAETAAQSDELNPYYTLMRQIVSRHGGVANSSDQERLLAFFGAFPSRCNHARQATRAALEIRTRVALLNDQRARQGVSPIRVGIGVNTGRLILGRPNNNTYCVYNDTVNTANQLSNLNKTAPIHSIFIGQETRDHLNGERKWLVENLGQIPIAGRETAVSFYALLEDY